MAFVLHIDDEPALRALMFEMLAALDIECDSAASFQEGLDRARKRKPDLILLDVMMPGVDGFQGCRVLRADAALKDVPIVMVTALDGLDHVERAFAAGAKDFITKPLLLAKLKAKLAKHLPPPAPGA